MAKVIAIVGLPASGKTHYGKNLSKKTGGLYIDDPKNWSDLEKQLINYKGDTVILSDPFLCFEDHQEVAQSRFMFLGYETEWVFFENNPTQCKENAKARGDSSFNDIDWFSRKYSIPENAKIVPVWKS